MNDRRTEVKGGFAFPCASRALFLAMLLAGFANRRLEPFLAPLAPTLDLALPL